MTDEPGMLSTELDALCVVLRVDVIEFETM